jgi:hypothetical protein
VGGIFEDKIAEKLGLPIANATNSQQYWGTKAGSREIFHECEVPHPDGTFKVLRSRKDLIAVIELVCSRNLGSKKGVVKLMDGNVTLGNQGFAGRGNAVISLVEVCEAISSGKDGMERIIEIALEEMKFVCPNHDWKSFQIAIEEKGAIFELWIECPSTATITSPSVQVVIDAKQKVTVLSTHEQLLDGQIYYGCDFPANSAYSKDLIEYGKKVGEFLARKRIQDHFSIDFVCSQDKDQVVIQATEVNLRITGTTAPFMNLHLLSKGKFDIESGNYVLKDGSCRYYRSSDHIHNAHFKKLLPCDLLDFSRTFSEVGWDRENCVGVIFHMMGQISQYGGLGLTAIGQSKEEAKYLFEGALKKLEAEANVFI